jgi:hypothetical protein
MTCFPSNSTSERDLRSWVVHRLPPHLGQPEFGAGDTLGAVRYQPSERGRQAQLRRLPPFRAESIPRQLATDHWNHPPPLFGNAIDLYGVAQAQGFAVSGQPAPGAMVVYGSSYGLFGHIATVIAVEPGRYEVIEQNFLDFDADLEGHWATFDLRSVAWPGAAVVGFVVAPSTG